MLEGHVLPHVLQQALHVLPHVLHVLHLAAECCMLPLEAHVLHVLQHALHLAAECCMLPLQAHVSGMPLEPGTDWRRSQYLYFCTSKASKLNTRVGAAGRMPDLSRRGQDYRQPLQTLQWHRPRQDNRRGA